MDNSTIDIAEQHDESPSLDSYVLSHHEVSALLSSIALGPFVTDLVKEIERTYLDANLKTITRTGWSTPELDTLEIMGCKALDYTCTKLISSNPSIARDETPVVTGTLVCTTTRTDQARLVCDTAVLTPLRTAASTAVALKRLKPGAKTLGIVGAGLEGAAHAFVLALMLSDINEIVLTDLDIERATKTAAQTREFLEREKALDSREISIRAVDTSRLAEICDCDVVVTATYATSAVFGDVDASAFKEGAVIAAVGADLREKRELGLGLYNVARFVADDLAQCLEEGELQHAASQLGASAIEIAALRGHGGQLLDGRIISAVELLRDPTAFTTRTEPLTIYDSTGFSGQDLAVARIVIPLLEEKGWVPCIWNPLKTSSLFDLIDLAKADVA